MKTIYKYVLKLETEQAVLMPESAVILSAGLDPQQRLCIWAAVNTNKPIEPKFIHLFGTGHEVEEEEEYDFIAIDTVTQGEFVWHVFQKVHKDRLNNLNLRDDG